MHRLKIPIVLRHGLLIRQGNRFDPYRKRFVSWAFWDSNYIQHFSQATMGYFPYWKMLLLMGTISPRVGSYNECQDGQASNFWKAILETKDLHIAQKAVKEMLTRIVFCPNLENIDVTTC